MAEGMECGMIEGVIPMCSIEDLKISQQLCILELLLRVLKSTSYDTYIFDTDGTGPPCSVTRSVLLR